MKSPSLSSFKYSQILCGSWEIPGEPNVHGILPLKHWAQIKTHQVHFCRVCWSFLSPQHRKPRWVPENYLDVFWPEFRPLACRTWTRYPSLESPDGPQCSSWFSSICLLRNSFRLCLSGPNLMWWEKNMDTSENTCTKFSESFWTVRG